MKVGSVGSVLPGVSESLATGASLQRTDEVAKAASLANFAHQPAPAPTTVPAPCSFTGAALTSATAPQVFPLLQRAANAASAPGLPGATSLNQQIFIDGAGTFNRVVITLCWKTSSDSAWRRHTLVTYVN